MNNETKELPVPSLNPEQVQSIMKYANETLPTMYGLHILKFIEKVALETQSAEAKTE